MISLLALVLLPLALTVVFTLTKNPVSFPFSSSPLGVAHDIVIDLADQEGISTLDGDADGPV